MIDFLAVVVLICAAFADFFVSKNGEINMDRIKEPSTWAGFAGIFGAIAHGAATHDWYGALLTIVPSIVAIWRREAVK